MAVDVCSPLLDKLARHLLLLEGDKCKILGLIIVGFVHGADDLCDNAILSEVALHLLCGQAGARQPPQVNFAWLGLGLLAGNFLALEKK